MRAIWSGTARSASRVDRASGQPIEYRLVAYDDGTATCTCPDYAFQGARATRTPDERLRYRCKHLKQAIAQAIADGAFADGSPEPPAARPEAYPPSGPDPAATVPEPPPLFDDDEEEYFEPLVRR